MESAVSLQKVSRHFGTVKALDEIDLEVVPGEFFAMLGPSGSGKTTCLRLIAGFEQPNAGHIRIFDEAVEGVPPYRRNVNTVFQDYALFPHMNVVDNVAFSLMLRKVERKGRQRVLRSPYPLCPGDTFHLQSVGHIVQHIHMREECAVLEHGVDVAPIRRNALGAFAKDRNGARGWLFETGDEAKAGGFARPGWPEHGEELTGLHLQVDRVDRFNAAEMARYVLE
jgi:ABC-type sugar transport system ATPase subunit